MSPRNRRDTPVAGRWAGTIGRQRAAEDNLQQRTQAGCEVLRTRLALLCAQFNGLRPTPYAVGPQHGR